MEPFISAESVRRLPGVGRFVAFWAPLIFVSGLVSIVLDEPEEATQPTATSTIPTTPPTADVDPIVAALDDPTSTVVATATGDTIAVHEAPGAPEPREVLPGRDTALAGFATVFVVIGHDDAGWLEVRLPTVNGAIGWIPRDAVEVTQHRYSIVVDPTTSRLEVRRAGDVIFVAPIAFGPDAPPAGAYFVTAATTLADATNTYGSIAFTLSGEPVSVEGLDAGTGLVGLHGTNLDDVVGAVPETGSIHLRDTDAATMGSYLPLGTPVEVR